MGRFARQHPVELQQAIGRAVADGTKAAEVHRQVNAGTFPDWDGPYEIAYSVVLDYGNKERRRRAAQDITPDVQARPLTAIDQAAKSIIDAALNELRTEREKDRPNLEKLGNIAVLLKRARDLVQPNDPTQPATKTTRARPTDDLGATLAKAAKQADPSPSLL